MTKYIYVGNRSFDSTEEGLKEAFGAPGAVTSARIIPDCETGRTRGYAFVAVEDAALGSQHHPTVRCRLASVHWGTAECIWSGQIPHSICGRRLSCRPEEVHSMFGIAGIIECDRRPGDADPRRRMIAPPAHRGPGPTAR